MAKNFEHYSSKMASIRLRANSRSRQMVFVVVGALAAFLVLQWLVIIGLRGQFLPDVPMTILNSALVLNGAFFLAQLVAWQMASVSAYRVVGQIFPIWTALTLFGFAVLLLLRLDYSFWYTIWAFLLGTASLAWFAANLTKRHRHTIGLPADMMSENLQEMGGVEFVELSGPDLPDTLVDAIAIDQSHLINYEWTPFLSWCAINAVPVVLLYDYLERHTGKVDLNNFALGDALRIRTIKPYMSIKRLYDVLICTIALAILAIPMVIAAIIIRLESPGPALFTQRRLGRAGRPFTIYKFRSMRTDAETSGAQFAGKNDPRITRIGAFIRKSRIDELPQLVNVIKGDMSLIGPRPEQVDLMDSLVTEIPLFPLRHSVRPGITGWAQVCQGYADDVASTREKVAYDLFYIKNVSVLLDLNIVLRTVRIIISGFGAR